MAKYTISTSEDTRQRILSLPRGVKFAAFMRAAMDVFIEELEKDNDLEPGDFTIALKSRDD